MDTSFFGVAFFATTLPAAATTYGLLIVVCTLSALAVMSLFGINHDD